MVGKIANVSKRSNQHGLIPVERLPRRQQRSTNEFNMLDQLRNNTRKIVNIMDQADRNSQISIRFFLSKGRDVIALDGKVLHFNEGRMLFS